MGSGEIYGAGEAQATACPADTSRAGLQTLRINGSVLTLGVQDPPSHASRASPTQKGQLRSDKEEAGSLAELGLATLAHEVSKNSVQGSFLTDGSDCWLGCIHSVPGHTLKGVGPCSPATGAGNEHHCVPDASWEVFALIVSNSSSSQQPLEELPLALHY